MYYFFPDVSHSYRSRSHLKAVSHFPFCKLVICAFISFVYMSGFMSHVTLDITAFFVLLFQLYQLLLPEFFSSSVVFTMELQPFLFVSSDVFCHLFLSK